MPDVVRFERAVAATVAGCLIVTVGTLLVPPPRLSVDDATVRVALHTVAGIGILVAALLVLVSYRRRRSRPAIALALGLIVLGTTRLLTLALPEVLAGDSTLAWAPVPMRLIVPLLLIAAALLPATPLRRPPSTVVVGAAGLALSALACGAGALIGYAWPSAGLGHAVVTVPGEIVDLPSLPPTMLVIQLLALLGFGAAAALLIARARVTADTLLAACGLAAILITFARLLDLLVPALVYEWVTPADALKLGAVACLVVGAILEVLVYERRLAPDAVAAERRRLARELHDGLAQELAYIVSQTSRLAARGKGDADLQMIARAGERALIDSRRAIHQLKRDDGGTLGYTIAEQAWEWAQREGLGLDVEILDEVQPTPEVENAILRIVQEAISNAARHSGATIVSIQLAQRDGRVTVRISDDGRGFDAAPGQRRRGFGLVSMAERAESFGAELTLVSQPGEGTVVEVAFR